MIRFRVNGKAVELDGVAPDTPLLWVLRDNLRLTGTRYGCGILMCGACTVHVDGVVTRSCGLPVGGLQGKSVTTIEGLSEDGEHAVQKAWRKHFVAQCGFCQSGQIMSAAALLKTKPKPTDQDIDEAMAGNICRCGTYGRIRAAIHDAAKEGNR